MKHPGRKAGSPPRRPSTSEFLTPAKLWACVSVAALIAGLWLYSPALNGPFLFDDFGLPFQLTSRVEPLASWVSGVRPVLMFSYWLNNRLWGDGAFSYHVVNVLIHTANVGLVFLIFLRLMGMAGWSDKRARIASAIGAAVFLVHPLETESVSYVAGRSESLASLFLLMAYVCFLYRRRESIAWSEALAVMLLVWHRRQDKGERHQPGGHTGRNRSVLASAVLVQWAAQELALIRAHDTRRNFCRRVGVPHAGRSSFRGLLAARVHLVSIRVHRSARHLCLHPAGAPAARPIGRSRFFHFADHRRTWGSLFFMLLLALLVALADTRAAGFLLRASDCCCS